MPKDNSWRRCFVTCFTGRGGVRCRGSLTRRARHKSPHRRMTMAGTKTEGKAIPLARNFRKRGDKLINGALAVLGRGRKSVSFQERIISGGSL